MATVYFDKNGKVFQVFATAVGDVSSKSVSAEGSIEFDHITNNDLLGDLLKNTDDYTVEGGVLMKDGAPVTLAASCACFVSASELKTIRDALKAGNTLTTAQLSTLLRYLFFADTNSRFCGYLG